MCVRLYLIIFFSLSGIIHVVSNYYPNCTHWRYGGGGGHVIRLVMCCPLASHVQLSQHVRQLMGVLLLWCVRDNYRLCGVWCVALWLAIAYNYHRFQQLMGREF